MSLHGISRDAWKRYTGEGTWYYEVVDPGFKYNMTDIAAALGLHQLRSACRPSSSGASEIARRYTDSFSELDACLRPARRGRYGMHAWHLYILEVNLEALAIGRNDFIERLRQKGVGTSVHFIPLHLHPFYQRDRTATSRGSSRWRKPCSSGVLAADLPAE